MSEYDQRQYHLMLQRIEQFERQQIGLSHFISDLEALSCALEDADPVWKFEFRKHWGVLEEVNAVTLDSERSEVSHEFGNTIESAIQRIKHLVSAQISATGVGD